MKIIFPRHKAVHRRDYDRELTAVIKVKGIFVNWNDAQRIYFAVQNVFDKADILQELSYRLQIGTITRKEASSAVKRMNQLAERYRMLLDDDVGETWNNTLAGVLEEFLENKKEA